MKALERWIRLLGAMALLGFGFCSRAGVPVRTLFHCTSVRIEPATVKALGDHRLAFNFSATASENGELAVLAEPAVDPVSNESVNQGTGFTLTAPGFGVPIEGDIYFETPQLDRNLNGVDDIFEVGMDQPAANLKGFLTYTTLDDETVTGSVNARWERSPGSSRGTVTLSLKFPGYAQSFVHAFEVFEYEGTLTYSRNGTNVTSTVQLERPGTTNRLAGEWRLQVVDNDVLSQSGAAWMADQPEIRFEPTSFSDGTYSSEVTRGGLNTNYFGFLYFPGGSPASSVPQDYALWEVDLFDGNDANRNGIPDLTDPEVGTPPVAPRISLTWESDAPRLHLSGSAGVDYVVEQSDSLSSGGWSPFTTNHLSAVQPAEIPLSTKGVTGQRFWRVRSH